METELIYYVLRAVRSTDNYELDVEMFDSEEEARAQRTDYQKNQQYADCELKIFRTTKKTTITQEEI